MGICKTNSLGQEGITAHCVQNILDSLAELLKVNPIKFSTFSEKIVNWTVDKCTMQEIIKQPGRVQKIHRLCMPTLIIGKNSHFSALN
jgi:hypothetical protein